MSIQLEYALSGLPYVYDPRNVPKDGYYVNDKTSVGINNFKFGSWKDMSLSTRIYAEKFLSSKASAESFIEILNKIS